MPTPATSLSSPARPMIDPAPAAPPAFAPRLGAHHFAHLRACAEGLDALESAQRFLGAGHGHEARATHRRCVEAVRALARRRGESAWRLIGLTIAAASGAASAPSLEDFMAERGLEGWSQAELAQMHAELYPLAPRAARREQLRARQMALLARLQALAAQVPLAGDAVAGWFDEATAQKLVTAGIVTLGALADRIALGGRWHRALPGIGPLKAARIAGFLALLLPPPAPQAGFALAARAASASAGETAPQMPTETPPEMALAARPMPGAPHSEAGASLASQGACAAPPLAGALADDAQAIEAWVQARAGSLATARVYRREATRVRLWLEHEAGAKGLRQMSAADCGAFMAFLQHIPRGWMSRARAAPGEKGWAPFRGPLSHQSQQQAIAIVASLYAWLHAAQYLSANPWVLINRKTGDDPARRLLDTKALSEEASAAIEAFVQAQPATPARARMLFLLRFVPAVGLRAAELLGARLGDLARHDGRWVLQVHGKGAKNRLVAIPGQALQALEAYLDARALGPLESAAPQAPLLASTLDPLAAVGYSSLYESVKRWLARALRAAKLPDERERAQLARASTHWLRHTFGTRAVARGVPLDVIQAQMGHASIQTTSAIYARAPLKRRLDALQRAFD